MIDMPVEVRGLTLTAISVAVVVVLLQFMQSILIPFVLAGLLFYALDPLVDALEQRRLPRAIGAGLILMLVVTGGGAMTLALQDQFMTVIDELPAGARKLGQSFRRTAPDGPTAIAKVQQAADELQKTTAATTPPAAPAEPGVVRVQVEQQRFNIGNYVLSGSFGLLAALNQLVMILFLTYFMLLSDQLFKRKLVEIVGPTLERKKVTVKILEDIATAIEQFLIIQILTSAVVALATWGALWWMGLRQAALWGLVAGVLNSIPYYGPLVVTGLLAVVAFLQFGTLEMTGAVAGVALLIPTLEGTILTPRLVGKAAKMNTVSVFAGLLFWSWVWGIWGILLAVPMMMVLKVICDRVEPLQPIGHLLGE